MCRALAPGHDVLTLRWSFAAETAGLGPAREVSHDHLNSRRPRRPGVFRAGAAGLSWVPARYSGLTRETYSLDLRQFASWCHRHHLALFAVRRARHECFGRDLENARRPRRPSPGGSAPGSANTPSKRKFPGRARPPSPAGLQVPRHRAGLQRGRDAPCRRRTRHGSRASPDVAARGERAPDLRGHRRRHRGARYRARAPDARHHPQKREEGRHPARPRTARALDPR
jgi:hypothetical protein